MSLRYPGGLITKSPTAPTTSAAKGVWTLEQALQYIKAGTWPLSALGDPYFQYNTMLLPGQGTNGAQNNTFLDSSTNNFTITRNGNTTQGTFTPFSQAAGYWSAYFDGSGDYVDVASGASISGTGDFTVEAWICPSQFNAGVAIVQANTTVGALTGILINSTGTIGMGRAGIDVQASSSFAVALNVWSHVAVTRQSGTVKIFINGVQGYSGTITTSYNSGTVRFGTESDGSSNPFKGFISNYRSISGSALYTSNFTPSTSPLSTVSGTTLLTLQSNRFVDNSANAYAVTPSGNVAVTPFEPFGAPTSAYSASTVGGSGYFDGSGDYLNVASNAAFNIEGGAYTIEGWVYFNAISTSLRLLVLEGSSTNGLIVGSGSTNNLEINQFGTGTILNGTNALVGVTNAWAHICIVSNGTNRSMFVNGTRFATTTSAVFPSSNNAVGLGGIGGTYAGSNPNAYFSGWRIVKGTAVYDPTQTTLTVPTAPLTAITNTSLLCNFTNAGIIDNAEKNDLETVGNAQISTSQYKFGTSSMYFDGTGDWLIVDGGSPNYIFGTGDFTIEMWINPSTVSPSYQGIWDSRTADPSVTPHITLASGAPVWWVSGAARITGSTLTASTWYHLAVSRTGGSTKMFVNGNQVGSTYADTNNYTSRSLPTIGVNFDGLYPFTGYLQDLRITKGYARYPYNFTAPTAAFPLFYQAAATPTSDPYFDYTTLLLPGNGTNGAQNNTFLDSSTNAFTITRNGNTTQGTFTPFSQTGWGNYFDGTGDYLTVANNSAFDVGAGDFCIETWFYAASVSSQQFLFTWSGAGTGLELEIKASGEIGFSLGTGSWVYTNQAAGSIQANLWNHVAYVRASGTLSIFINGARTFTASNSSTVGNPSTTVSIGAYRSSSNYLNGYMSNFRFVKGSGVYNPSQTTITVPTSPLTAVSGTSLLTCQSNRFIDNSTNAFTITRNGDTSVQAFSPFNPTASYSTSTVGGSGYFDGSGDYLTGPTNTATAFNLTGNFTIECFAYFNSVSTAYAGLVSWSDSSGWNGWQFLNNAGTITFEFLTGSAAAGSVTSSTAVTTGQWYHIAAVRSSSTITLYLNGVSVGTSTYSSSQTSSSSFIKVAADRGASNLTTGYISNLRVVNGTAVYTSAFTPPTAPLTAITNTQLLLSGTNGGITDATAKNDLETVGGASISTTQSKFGGSSLAFDGSGDYLVTPSKDLLNLGSGDFTVEAWVYTSSSVAYAMIIDKSNDGGGGTGWFLEWSSTRGLALYDGSTTVAAAYTVSTGVWYHIAATRYSGNILLFVNGVRLSTTANTTNLTSTTRVTVGATNSTGSYALNGYINDLRVTKGVARYTTNFTPPTSAFLTL